MLCSCHEVNLFLKLKDPAFFDAVVRPFVASKHALEFMDHWVLDHDLKPYTRLDMVSVLASLVLLLMLAFSDALVAPSPLPHHQLAKLNAAEVALLVAKLPASASRKGLRVVSPHADSSLPHLTLPNLLIERQMALCDPRNACAPPWPFRPLADEAPTGATPWSGSFEMSVHPLLCLPTSTGPWNLSARPSWVSRMNG